MTARRGAATRLAVVVPGLRPDDIRFDVLGAAAPSVRDRRLEHRQAWPWRQQQRRPEGAAGDMPKSHLQFPLRLLCLPVRVA
jgi:hypothetical protein